MKSFMKSVTVIVALLAILGIVKITAEALGIRNHKYFEVEDHM